MAKHLTLFEVRQFDDTICASLTEAVRKTISREFSLEANLIRAQIARNKGKNLIIRIPESSQAGPEHVRSLVRLLREARDHGGAAAFCGGGEAFQQLLGRLKLSRQWAWYPSLEQAVAAIRNTASEQRIR
ncbi:MAG: hypothetical protein DWQ34_20705 [Planctomycetota bacterium]|nr:MAG: hypothetical protein DWQ34_20705 [Planctomycetota bacterium]REK29006.1 MAG: hypothetical protein DWQ41_05530 [Planctomycetota bacterium]REK39562.1 MAG: hypothetical protein DWQ45_01415 [Planctomycetota bacterium]